MYSPSPPLISTNANDNTDVTTNALHTQSINDHQGYTAATTPLDTFVKKKKKSNIY